MAERTLVLLRHAKAETPGERPDFDRSLTRAGKADAAAAGVWLADEGLRPDLVLCSPARRTRQTWQGVESATVQAAPNAPAPEVIFDERLYDGGRTEVIDLLRASGDDRSTVLVIGHNPTMSDVSLLLRPDDQHGEMDGLKTAGIAVHRAEGPWSRTEPGSMALVARHTARG